MKHFGIIEEYFHASLFVSEQSSPNLLLGYAPKSSNSAIILNNMVSTTSTAECGL